MAAGTTYFDGQTAARYEAVLRLDAAGLHISGAPSDHVWPYAEIHYASEEREDLPLTFRRGPPGHDAARLTVGDRATIDSLRIRCPDLEDRARRNRSRNRGIAWGAAGMLSLGLIVWSIVHYLPRIVAPMLPRAWEERVGDNVIEDIKGIFGTATNGEVNQCETADGRLALDILLGQLVDQVRTPYRFTVTVLDVDMVNALAAPGGRIVVFRKLLTEANSPDDLAGVLAHEMGHVISRHPTEAVVRSMGISLVFNVLMGGLGSGAAGAAGQALISSAYSRDAERDADRIALQILSGARISPKGFAEFFERMARDEGGAGDALSLLSTHPPSEERARAARETVSDNVRPALSEPDWRALRNICG